MKKVVRLTESDLVRLVNKVIKEQKILSEGLVGSIVKNGEEAVYGLNLNVGDKGTMTYSYDGRELHIRGDKSTNTIIFPADEEKVKQMSEISKKNTQQTPQPQRVQQQVAKSGIQEQERDWSFLDEHYVKKFKEQGFKEVPKLNLTDGDYLKGGGGYSIQLYGSDKKHTGHVLVTKSGIRGMWMGQPIKVEQGTTPSVEVYKILFNKDVVGKESDF